MAEVKGDKSKPSSQSKSLPKDAQVILSIIKDMGIQEAEPRVVNQLLEFTYRYVSCILEDAKTYANHAKKKFIDLYDVRFAVQSLVENSMTQPPPREYIIELARAKNAVPLPLVKPHSGVRLPQDRYCLSTVNVKVAKLTPSYSSTNRERNLKIVTKSRSELMKDSSIAPASAKSVSKLNTNTRTNLQDGLESEDNNSSKRKRDDDDYDL